MFGSVWLAVCRSLFVVSTGRWPLYRFLFGCCLGVVVTGFVPVLPPFIALLLAGLALFPLGLLALQCGLLTGLRSSTPFLCGLFAGVLLACLYGERLLSRQLPLQCEREAVLVRGQIVSLVERGVAQYGSSSQRFQFHVDAIEPAVCNDPQRLALTYFGDTELSPGQYWQFTAVLSRPWGQANPGLFNGQSWYVQQGIDARGSVRGEGARLRNVELASGVDIRLWPQLWRNDLRRVISSLPVNPPTRSLLSALTYGDKRSIDSHLWSQFQVLGVSHLLVISGLHVGLVAAAGFAMARLLMWLLALLLPGLSVATAAVPPVAAVGVATFYTALAGFSLPTQRALFMLLVFVLATAMGRPTRAFAHLLLAGFLVLVLNPLAALGAGFWLSFTAVAALLWLNQWQPVGPSDRWGSRALRTHGYMTLLMLPVSGWFFGGASLIAVVANLLLIPLVGLVIVPTALLAASVSLLVGPGVPEGQAPEIVVLLASLLWLVAGAVVDGLFLLLHAVARWGEAGLFTSLQAPFGATLLALIAVLVAALPKHAVLRLSWLPLLLPLLLPLSLPSLPPRFSEAFTASAPAASAHRAARVSDPYLWVTVLDVGQGTSVVVRSPHRTLLYDTGGGRDWERNMAQSVVLPYLQRIGVTALDTFVVSHSDSDHSLGAPLVLRTLPVSRLRLGGTGFDRVSGAACRAGESWVWPESGAQFQFLSPFVSAAKDFSQGSKAFLRRNNQSCVLQIRLGQSTLLLPGDIEADAESELVRFWGKTLQSDWLLVGHHGSKTSTTWRLLKHVVPRQAIVSAARGNRFGHPHDGVLSRFQAIGTQVSNTADNGALRYMITPEEIVILPPERDRSRRYWM